MASRSRAGRSSRSAAMRESSASIPVRQRPSVSSMRSFTQVGDLERTVSTLDEPLHTRFHFAQLLGRGAQTGDAFLEQRERPFQLQLLGLELAHDLLEPVKPLLEAHFDSSTSVTRAPTVPSRRTTSNDMSVRNCAADVSA